MSTTRERLLKAALKVFSQKGYRGATTRAIAREAGVNEVTLFRHFGAKQHLFTEIIATFSAIPHIEEVRAKTKVSFETRLRDLSDHVLEILQARRDLIALLLSEGPRRGRQARIILESGPGQVLRHLSRWFAEARSTGAIRRDLDPECAARAFMGMFFMYVVLQQILPGDQVFPVDPDEAKRTFNKIFLRGALPRGKKR